jgi:hypothetical protein
LKRDVVTKVKDLGLILLLLAVLDMRVTCKHVKPVTMYMKTHTLLRLPPGQVSGFLALSGIVPLLATIPRHGHISGIIGS